MSLWQEYQRSRVGAELMIDIEPSIRPSIYSWIHKYGQESLRNPYTVAVELKNVFHINGQIPSSYRNNYSEPPAIWKFANFLMLIADDDSKVFFTIIDYLVQNYPPRANCAQELETILKQAGHTYSVQQIDGKHVVTERISETDQAALEVILSGERAYNSEFHDAFTELYGTKPNYTHSALESFQALESALKFFLGDDKGNNLGAILDWLRNNGSSWKYTHASEGQEDVEDQFLALINFVNKSFRKTKHGQADKKLAISKEHAEIILRAVGLLINELEKTIKLIS